METDYKEIYLDIICSTTKEEFVSKMVNFCDFAYEKLIDKLKEVHLNKNKMDFSLIISIENINKEINEFVDKINNIEIISNQNEIATNLLYGLILNNDPLLWVYFNQKYITIYN
jgi:hypothetical protein